MSGSSAVAPSTPPPPAAAAPLCLLTQFTVATFPLPLPSTPTGCLWLCIFDLLSSFSYFLLFWHSQRLRWTHKGGQQQEGEGQVAWAGMRGMHGAGGGGGQASWSAALTNFVRLHFAHGPETTSARRSLRGYFFCFDFTFLCNIYTQYLKHFQRGGFTTKVHNYLKKILLKNI